MPFKNMSRPVVPPAKAAPVAPLPAEVADLARNEERSDVTPDGSAPIAWPAVEKPKPMKVK